MKAVVVVFTLMVVLAPRDVPKQCDQPVFARSNPGLCYAGPFGSFPGTQTGGGGSGGGILGAIGRVLGGLTGGLL